MKKVLLFTVVALFTAGIFATSCSEDNPVNCTQLGVDYATAHNNYVSDDSNENCIALKNAIEDYLDTDCPVLTAAYRTTLQIELEALPCYP
ncbi:MAG: hypothetical protein KAQ75_03540 [Bacteroidales bacterium]|nr:hypothetical protein [Bacteroidales bacterium]